MTVLDAFVLGDKMSGWAWSFPIPFWLSKSGNGRFWHAIPWPFAFLPLGLLGVGLVADGFYEWKPVGNAKRPYFARPVGGGPIAFAGIGGASLYAATAIPIRIVFSRNPVCLRNTSSFSTFSSRVAIMPKNAAGNPGFL